jgi:hypothetical protein
MQLFGCGVWLPKALAEFLNQVLSLSNLSVTLLRLNMYYLLIHGSKHFISQHLVSTHHISTCYSMQYNGSSSLISCEKQTIRIEFLSLQGNLNTQHVGALHPHTHQPSPSIPWQQIRAHRLGVQCLTDPDYRRAVTALVPTITRMGDHVSGRVRGYVCGQVHSGIRLTDLPYFSACA